MSFSLPAHWVWDFWLADDGHLFHLFYLHAPKSLEDEQLRHRNARIGHATSPDLISWTDLGVVLSPGHSGAFDETATWTGSVLRGPDGLWRMFYTGARFLTTSAHTNIEAIGVATSPDLHHWTKAPEPITRADPQWYETLGDSAWPEESWRDPWVFEDPDGDGWHMLVTARAGAGDERDRGVIGHAISADLESWHVQSPLSAPGAGFAHLEVPQVARIGERMLLLFSCDRAALAGDRTGGTGGIWALPISSLTGPYGVAGAKLLIDESLYSGRMIQDRSGRWMLLAFENSTNEGEFGGALSDPIPLAWPSSAAAPALRVESAHR